MSTTACTGITAGIAAANGDYWIMLGFIVLGAMAYFARRAEAS